MSKDNKQSKGSDGMIHTVNSTQDPKALGSYYHTQVDSNGNKAMVVYNSNGSLANVKANKGWK